MKKSKSTNRIYKKRLAEFIAKSLTKRRTSEELDNDLERIVS
jgi:hypothetical protein